MLEVVLGATTIAEDTRFRREVFTGIWLLPVFELILCRGHEFMQNYFDLNYIPPS
jgi:hypothetical protein